MWQEFSNVHHQGVAGLFESYEGVVAQSSEEFRWPITASHTFTAPRISRVHQSILHSKCKTMIKLVGYRLKKWGKVLRQKSAFFPAHIILAAL